MSKFKTIWKNQKEIGIIYGKSAIAVGKALIELGLRDAQTKTPTEIAITDGIAKSTPLKDGIPFYLWQIDRTCEKLNTLPDWQPQSQAEREIQELSNEYSSYINAALKADENGEHHVIVDGYYDAAQSAAKNIKKDGQDLVGKINAILKGKIPSIYLI